MTPRAGTVRVLLARHGRTTLNASGRLRGHLDPPLDEVGEREVRVLADALEPEGVCLVVSSPLLLDDTITAATSPVVLVAHDAVNRLLLTTLRPDLAADPSFAQATACWNVLERHDGSPSWTVMSVNLHAS